MGVTAPNETKCLYKILPNGNTLRKKFILNLKQNFLIKEHLDIVILEN
jgi:hypothetical protein